MSRRKDPMDEFAEQLGCLLIGLVWAAIVGLLALIFKASHVSPEEKLRNLQPSYVWNWQIKARDCPTCGTINESYVHHCYQCGTVLFVPEPSTAQSTADGGGYTWLIVLGVLFTVLVLIAIASNP